MSRALLIALAATCCLCRAAAAAEPVRGVTLAHLWGGQHGYGSDACRGQLDELSNLGANWVALCDFAYLDGVTNPTVRVGNGRGDSAGQDVKRTVADAHARGLKVMIKCHLWSREFGRGVEWHGTIRMKDEAEWAEFFGNYTAYVVAEAKVAQQSGADAVCVGVEMKSTSGREADWRRLVAAVRAVYDGPLAYSANGDEWQTIAWWDAVDVVGISAYFPLSDERPATADELRDGWAKVYAELDAFHARTNKPILFAELGYSRSATAAAMPSVNREDAPVSGDYQALLYRVALEEAAKRDYVVGVFLWKWFTGSAEQARRTEKNDVFGLQNRPETLAVLRERWASTARDGTKQ